MPEYESLAKPRLRPPDIDRELTFRPWDGVSGVCRLRSWFDDRTVVLVTEIDRNTGPSVTNSAEAIGSAVELLIDETFNRFDLVEHYEPNLFRSNALAVVQFVGRDRLGRPYGPSWSPLPGRLDWLEDAVVVG